MEFYRITDKQLSEARPPREKLISDSEHHMGFPNKRQYLQMIFPKVKLLVGQTPEVLLPLHPGLLVNIDEDNYSTTLQYCVMALLLDGYKEKVQEYKVKKKDQQWWMLEFCLSQQKTRDFFFIVAKHLGLVTSAGMQNKINTDEFAEVLNMGAGYFRSEYPSIATVARMLRAVVNYNKTHHTEVQLDLFGNELETTG